MILSVGISLAIVAAVAHSFSLSKSSYYRPSHASSSDMESSATTIDQQAAVQVKLPMIQVYVNSGKCYSGLVAEFIIGNDMTNAPNMFVNYINQKAKEVTGEAASINYSWPVENIYSDSLLQRALAANPVVVLKLYRVGCKKCNSIEQLYYATASEHKSIKFIQSNVNHVPLLSKATMSRLRGETTESKVLSSTTSSTIDCLTCHNTGFVSCLDCVGKGYVMKKALAVTCSACVGFKKVRCGSCGGRCLKCDF